MFLFETLLQILSVSTLVSLPRHAPTINKILPGGSFHILNSRYPYQFFSLGKEEKNQKPKAVVLIHSTSYDGAVELAAMQMEIPSVSCSTTHLHFKTACDVVKDHLLKAILTK